MSGAGQGLLPILMYHSIADDPPAATRALSVRPRDFAAQLAHLAAAGYTGLTFGDACARLRGGTPLPARPIVITFDDGYADLHEQALPLLVEHGFPATVFVTTGWLHDAGDRAAGRPLDRMATWSQVRELAACGVEVAAHSHSHPELDQLPDAALAEELHVPRALIEDALGRAVTGLAYPFGYSSARVRRAVAAAGYAEAASVANRAVTAAGHDRFAVPRLTVARSTTPAAFARAAACTGLPRLYARERVLTHGYSVVRRARRLTPGRVSG